MSEPMKLDTHEKLTIHIAGLQATLTQRNERIKYLEKELAQPTDRTVKIEREAYKRGWQDCSNRLSGSVQKLAVDLREIRKEAWSLYLEEERRFNQSHSEEADD